MCSKENGFLQIRVIDCRTDFPKKRFCITTELYKIYKDFPKKEVLYNYLVIFSGEAKHYFKARTNKNKMYLQGEDKLENVKNLAKLETTKPQICIADTGNNYIRITVRAAPVSLYLHIQQAVKGYNLLAN